MAGAKPEKKTERVKVGSVTLTIFPDARPDRNGKVYWKAIYRDREGKRRYITRADKKDLISAAKTKARQLHNQSFDLACLTREEEKLCRAFLDLKPSWDTINLLRERNARASISAKDAFDEFIEVKKANAGPSPHHVRALRSRISSVLKPIEENPLSSITTQELQTRLDELPWTDVTRKKAIGSLGTFFNWAQNQGYVGEGKTAPQKLSIPIIKKKTPCTLSPEELWILIQNVSPVYLPWLAISSLAGVRREELYPNSGSEKAALQWEDFDWKAGSINVPPEVSKTNRRRHIQICASLRDILSDFHQSIGPCCEGPPPERSVKGESETKRLGDLIGGWRPNVLRHSFVSYRCTQAGSVTASNEAGNSESETRSSYLDLKTPEEAEKYFANPAQTQTELIS